LILSNTLWLQGAAVAVLLPHLMVLVEAAVAVY
jgi:hypothetical protein